MTTSTTTSPVVRAGSLSSRRGSVSAPDPFALHALDQNAGRNVTSTLTIVRVPSVPADDMGGPADGKRRRRRSSGGSVGSTGSGRISFAAFGGAFTPIHAPQPQHANARPNFHARKGSQGSIASTPSRPYTPVELVQIAHDATHPTTPSADPFSSPLADDVLLPFLDRPQEVAALIATPPTAKLFALLAKTLPTEDAPKDASPAKWSYSQLEHWLTVVDRKEADDVAWNSSVRACVAPRSELVWERIKGAFGVPPELEPDVGPAAGMPDDLYVDIEPVFLDDSPESPDGAIAEDPVDAKAAEAIQGLRILNSPTFPMDSPQLGAVDKDPRPKPISAHPHVAPRPHFPNSFSDVNVNERPPLLSRHSSGSRPASPVPSPGSNYAHFVAQRLLNNSSPASRMRAAANGTHE
ncbi:hypothetical protein EXIGLDRAFT_717573 [Exidia glandulosa HHB12029]|uniref:Uncharacterized protein n=2 Tax=Exidia glandulosa HHB12029 TaxID=1314781 RepID=A0A165IB18_EXIGL|nr:hypothetical protein EXIGLDRAFT_717573 [Exidia glandulosa HHB12029]